MECIIIAINRILEHEWLKLLNDDNIDFQFLTSIKRQDNHGWRGTDDCLGSHLLFYVESGIVEGFVNNHRIILPPASLIWLTPGTRRIFWLKEDMMVTKNYRIRFNLKSGGKHLVFHEPYIIKNDAWRLLQYFQIIASSNWKSSFHSNTEKRALLLALFAALFDSTESVQSKFRKFSSREMQIVESEINMTLFDNFNQAKLAKQLNFSQDYFTRLFKETYGISTRTYLKKQKLHLAAEYLIDSSLTLKEICYKIKENNISKFCRQFKEEFKCTPTQYRMIK